MATYTDLHTLRGPSSETLRKKISIALVVKANAVSKATPTPAQLTWAISALTNQSVDTERVLGYIIGEYVAAPVGSITGATDEQVQTAVNAAVDTLLGA